MVLGRLVWNFIQTIGTSPAQVFGPGGTGCCLEKIQKIASPLPFVAPFSLFLLTSDGGPRKKFSFHHRRAPPRNTCFRARLSGKMEELASDARPWGFFEIATTFEPTSGFPPLVEEMFCSCIFRRAPPPRTAPENPGGNGSRVQDCARITSRPRGVQQSRARPRPRF